MGRIKLNRPPPVSGETAKDTAAENTVTDSLSNNRQNILTGSQTEGVPAADISTVCEKDPSDVKLINREYVSATADDTRRVVKHRHTVCDARTASVSEDVFQGLFVSDTSANEPEKNQHRCNVITCSDTVQMSLPGSDEPHCGVQHVASSGDDSAFNHDSHLAHPSQETVMHIEPQQSAVGVNKKMSGSLLDDVLKGFLVKKLEVIENERKGTGVDYKDDGVEAVVQNKSKDFSAVSKLRRSKRSREGDKQQRDLDGLPAKSRYRDSYWSLPQHGNECTEAHSHAHCTKARLDKWPQAFIHSGLDHLSPHISHGVSGVEDMRKHNLGTEGSSFKRGHRKHQHKHSLHAKRHLEKKNRQVEYKPQSFDLPQLERSQSNECKSVSCLEQIRAFVFDTVPKFAQLPVCQDYVPLETNYESNASKTGDRKRQKSASSSHHCHHHHKKQKSAKHLTEDNKFAKRGIGKKSLRTTKTVQEDMLTSKKHVKHKHHHKKTRLPDLQVDYNVDKNETLPHVEAKDEAGAFNDSRSLSPLGMHHKHRKKHKKKKSSEKTASQISAQNVSLLPGKIDTEYEKISSDEEFIPMKVQRSEDDDDTAGSKLPHKMDTLNTDVVKQGQTNRKSATELPHKFLKLSGKRPKRRMHVSGTNSSAEGTVTSELVENGAIGQHPVQDAVEHFQVSDDTAVDRDTTEEALAPVVGASQDCADHVSTSHEVMATTDSASPEEAISSCDSDDRRVVQTVVVNADDANSKSSGDGHICSTDEVNITSQMSAKSVEDGDNLTETFISDKTLQLGEAEHQETKVENEKETSTHDDNDSADKIVLSDSTIETVDGEEHAADECKSESSPSETLEAFHPDNEPDAVGEETTTSREGEDKDRTEIIKPEEVSAVKDEGQNIADQQSVSDDSVAPTENCPLQLNQTSNIEALPTSAMSPGEGSSVTDTDENISSSRAVAPSNLMGPPLALPPSMAFKKPLPALKMRLRITDTSADIISSGAKSNDRDKKARKDESREEGNQPCSFCH